jgi:hypothetical protein
MRGFAQVCGGGVRSEPGPEHVHHPFAMQPVPGCEREQLDDGRRPPSRPGVVRNGATTDCDSEAAEQLDPHLGHTLTLLRRRAADQVR